MPVKINAAKFCVKLMADVAVPLLSGCLWRASLTRLGMAIPAPIVKIKKGVISSQPDRSIFTIFALSTITRARTKIIFIIRNILIKGIFAFKSFLERSPPIIKAIAMKYSG